MRTTIVIALLGLLMIGATVQQGPPPPPGLSTGTKFLSPKATELKNSLGSAMKIAPTLLIPSQFAITNITLKDGNFILSWNSNAPGPYQIWGKPSLTSSWSTQENITILLSQTFPQGENQFWKVQAAIPLLFLHANSPRLTWAVPQIAMSDSLQDFTVQRRTDEPPIDQAIADNTGWTTIATLPSAARSYEDTAPPPVYYRLKQTTVAGVEVPYPVRFLTNQAPGTASMVNIYNGTGSDSIQAVVTDASGNMYVAGYFNGTIVLGGQSFTALGLLDMYVMKLNSSGATLFVKRFGNSGAFQTPAAIGLDSSGNIYVGGNYLGTANFGGSNRAPVGFQKTAFIAKYDASGNHLWDSVYGGTDSANIWALAIGPDDQVVVTGSVRAAGGNVMTTTKKFSTTGSVDWSKTANDAQPIFAGLNEGQGVRIDNAGNIYVVGYANSGTYNFGGGNVSVPSTAGAQGYIAKYASDGTFGFGRFYGSTTNGIVTKFLKADLTPDKTSLVLFGLFQGEPGTDLGGGTIEFIELEGTDASEGYIAKFSTANGNWQANTHMAGIPGHAGTFAPWSLSINTIGSILITGLSRGTYNFGNGVGIIRTEQDSAFTVLYNSSMSAVWGNQFIGSSASVMFGSAFIGLNPVVCGYFGSTSTFAGRTLTNDTGNNAGYLIRLNP